MELHPLHKLYLGRGLGETGTFALRARLAPATATADDGPGAAGPSAGGAVPAAVAGLVALMLVGKLIGKVVGGR